MEKKINSAFLFIIGILSILFFYIPILNDKFQYIKSNSINEIEISRILFCQFTHYDFKHLFINVFIFEILGFSIVKKNINGLLLLLISNILFIPFMIYFFNEDIFYYRGLSGIVNSMFVLFFISLLLDATDDIKTKIISILLLGLFFVKISYEIFYKKSVVILNYEVVSTAHITGIFIALGVVLFYRKRKRRLTSSCPSCLRHGRVAVIRSASGRGQDVSVRCNPMLAQERNKNNNRRS